jgi:hypothetical protein
VQDPGKVVGALLVAGVVAVIPVWLARARGAPVVTLAKPAAGGRCLRPAADMRRNHPAVLLAWRERAVREGARVDHLADGRAMAIDLSASCLGCHGKTADFCDRCHADQAVALSCWGCHATEAGP